MSIYALALEQLNIKSLSIEELPREERIRVGVMAFLSRLRKSSNALDGDSAVDMKHLCFLMESLFQKFPDGNEEVLLRLSAPLLPELKNWLSERKIPLSDIGVRLSISQNNVIVPMLCNHGGADRCDCGEHPTKF